MTFHYRFMTFLHTMGSERGAHQTVIRNLWDAPIAPFTPTMTWIFSRVFFNCFSTPSDKGSIKRFKIEHQSALLLSVEACSTWKWKSESCSGLINESTEEACKHYLLLGLNGNDVKLEIIRQHQVARFTSSSKAPRLSLNMTQAPHEPRKFSISSGNLGQPPGSLPPREFWRESVWLA